MLLVWSRKRHERIRSQRRVTLWEGRRDRRAKGKMWYKTKRGRWNTRVAASRRVQGRQIREEIVAEGTMKESWGKVGMGQVERQI